MGLGVGVGRAWRGWNARQTAEYSNSIKLRLARYSGHGCCFICIPSHCTVIEGQKGEEEGEYRQGGGTGAGKGGECLWEGDHFH